MKLFDDTTIQVKSVLAPRVRVPAQITCPNCRVSCNKDANFCGRCGLALKAGTSALRALHPTSTGIVQGSSATNPKSLSSLGTLCICLLLVLVVIGTSAFAFSHLTNNPPTPQTQSGHTVSRPNGSVWYYSMHSQDDSVALQLHVLPKLAHYRVYVLWLINPLRPNQLLSLGPLIPDSHNNVSFRSGHLSIVGTNVQSLRGLFTRFAVTSELAEHKWMRPSSAPVLQGTVSATS